MEKLTMRQILSLTLTLFAVFFGAGNMIFPPAMGQLAGENYLQALAGFILTDAGIALLGMIAVVLVGNKIMDLGDLVSRRFSLLLSVMVYLLIGPLLRCREQEAYRMSWRFARMCRSSMRGWSLWR